MDDIKEYLGWWILFFIAIIIGIIFIFKQYESKKSINQYYLAQSNNALAIGVRIEYAPDEYISMNGHSLKEVIEAIDSLNKGLKWQKEY